ncbi:MAG: hypothetical protein WCA11_07050, partial [Terracidiphilus sp.]
MLFVIFSVVGAANIAGWIPDKNSIPARFLPQPGAYRSTLRQIRVPAAVKRFTPGARQSPGLIASFHGIRLA